MGREFFGLSRWKSRNTFSLSHCLFTIFTFKHGEIKYFVFPSSFTIDDVSPGLEWFLRPLVAKTQK